MCSRFENLVSPETLAQRYGVIAPPGGWRSPDIRPDNAVCAIGPAGAVVRRWGLTAAWSTKLLINARSETLAHTASFRPLLARRCLIPATAWFEWHAAANSGRKRKYRLSARETEVFCFAGLMDGERFTIVTRSAHADIAGIHQRMPAVIDDRHAADWIDPDAAFAAVEPLLQESSTKFHAEPLPDPFRPKGPQMDMFD